MGCDNGSILDECQFRLLSETVSTPFASFVRREEMKVCPVRTNEAAAVVWCACAVLVGTDVVDSFSQYVLYFRKKTVVTRLGHARPLIFILGTRTRNAQVCPPVFGNLRPPRRHESKRTRFPTPRVAFAVTFESRA